MSFGLAKTDYCRNTGQMQKSKYSRVQEIIYQGVQMKINKLALAVSALLISNQALAANYSFNYVALASNQFQAVGGDFGSNIAIGDTVTFTLNASAGSAFLAQSSDTIWAILGIDGGGSRDSSYNWNFYNNGSLVGSGATTESTGAIHLGPTAMIGFDGVFDKYVWNGTLNSSSSGDINIAADIGFNSPELINYGGFWSYGETSAQFIQAAPVPEPETYAMMLAGLGLMGAIVRRRNHK